MLSHISLFAGWGPCGALNSAGSSEFYFVATALQVLILGISSIFLLIANSRFVRSFYLNGNPRPAFVAWYALAALLRAFVLVTAFAVLYDFLFLDGNLNELYDEGIPCDPITTDVLMQAVSIAVLTLFVSYRQYRRYFKKRANR